LFRNILFKSPSSFNIVIFEKTGRRRIKNLILPDMTAYVFDSKLHEIFLSSKIITFFFAYVKQLKINNSKNGSSTFRVVAGQLWRIYILSVIKVINPKVVITLIDNHPVFHWLCDHYKGAEFMAVQNGSRTKVQLREIKTPFRIQHFFCFGNYEKDMYSKLGFKVDNYYPVGSLLSGYYSNTYKKNTNVIYDICIVSSWRGNIGNTADVQETMHAMRKLDMFLSRYIRETKLKAAIVLRSEPDGPDRNIPVYGDEKEYFKNIYLSNVDLIDPNFEDRNIYREMDQSEVIVTFGSTAPREAFGWGKKVLYCDFTGSNLYNDYNEILLFRDEDYELFKKRLNEIRNMPPEQYEEKTKEYATYLMNYNPNCPPNICIRQKIDHYLGK